MSYIVLKYDANRDVDQYVTGLAFSLLLNSDELEVLDAKLRLKTKKAFMDMTADQLVAQLVKERIPRSCELIKSKKEFKTDKALISVCGDEYVGLISSALKKKDLQHIFETQERAKAYEYLRSNSNSLLIADNYKALSLAAKDVHEYLAELEKGEQEKLAWVDAHAKATNDALKSLPILIKRNF